jgi:hypothetical protein
MRRSLLLGGVWMAAAAGAVGLGFLAVSLVDASASAPVAPSSSSAAGEVAASTGAAAGTQDLATAGGTVYASCRDGSPVLAGAPAAGWAIDDSSGAGEVEFRDGTQKIEVRVDCSTGEPRFSQEGPRADGGGSDDGSVPTSAPSSSVQTASGGDDRGGGRHGSDDEPGDDHGSGGHGSDG